MAATASNVQNKSAEEIIDIALREINNGKYEEAITLLDKAKRIYPDSRAEELQELIVKLRSNSLRKRTTKTMPSEKRTNEDSTDSKANLDYNNEQLSLVKRIKCCKSYYQILDVARDSSDSQIKKSYKKLALQLHPDKNHAPGSVEAFKLLGKAMAVLTDPIKRKEYDLYGANGNGTCGVGGGGGGGGSSAKFQKYSNQYYKFQREYNKFQRECYPNGTAQGPFNNDNDDMSAEDLFNMFFGSFPSQSYYRHRAYQAANQRQYQVHSRQPSLAFGLILVLILISMLTSFFSSDPIYNLSPSSKYPVHRQTQHLSVPYYVKQNFGKEYLGSLRRLEDSVEDDYVYTMKQNCFRERNYREAMMARARSFGSRAQLANAQGLKTPSCDNLSKIGVTRYSLF
uniref:J domain-containing protein n=1 Tax=Glossina palpalis gambiensis TaxID=67801 RepID=A0A1B0AV00_9MUSC